MIKARIVMVVSIGKVFDKTVKGMFKAANNEMANKFATPVISKHIRELIIPLKTKESKSAAKSKEAIAKKIISLESRVDMLVVIADGPPIRVCICFGKDFVSSFISE